MKRMYRIYHDNLELYAKMLKDIRGAKRYIYLETYKFNPDYMGRKFLAALEKKAGEQVDVRVIIDDIGSGADRAFFRELTDHGGKVRIFRRFRYSWLIRKNNQRDHRKLLVIDDQYSYVGSSNITDSSLGWREMNLRIENGCGVLIRDAFLENFQIAGDLIYRKKHLLEKMSCKDFEIIRDVPSIRYRLIRKRILSLIEHAKKEILIETPYFLPNRTFRKALRLAAKRGIRVIILIPERSDIRIVDILRERYLGSLERSGANIRLYNQILHSKMVVVDGKAYGVGSHNLDYRSDILQFEIMLFGTNKPMARDLRSDFLQALKDSRPFNYKSWKKRSALQIVLERLLIPLRYWL